MLNHRLLTEISYGILVSVLSEIHCTNEKTAFLMKLVHQLGLTMKSTATCTQLRRIRLGNFTLDNALVKQEWDSENIIQSISDCRSILSPEKLEYTRTFEIDQRKLLD